MTRYPLRFSFLFLFIFVEQGAAAGLFAATDHCVAWRTKKTMALFKEVVPVGKNCSISAEMIKVSEGHYRFEGRFPIDQFDSGEEDRDKEVFKILNGKKQKDLLFQSESRRLSDWQQMFASGGGVVSGHLKVAGVEYAIQPRISVLAERKVLAGRFTTDYSKFKINPPKIAGGLVAKVHDYLEFHFHFQVSKVKKLEMLLEKK